MDRWNNEGGYQVDEEDEPFEIDGDREPRTPKDPKNFGGAELEIPVEEEELVSV